MNFNKSYPLGINCRGAIFLDNNANLHYLFRRCLNANYIHSGNGADYAIDRVGRRIYIFFEWSDGPLDWKNNLDFPARAHGRRGDAWFVHRGFLSVWQSVKDEIVMIISRSVDEATDIICVGYSHGAALAGLCTEEMCFLYGDSVSVRGYGFGCPRFIFGKLPPSVRERFSSFAPIRNIPDIVTHLPPRILGYSHPASIIKIGKKGKYTPISAHYPSSYLAETK